MSRILLVEDSADIMDMNASMLKLKGYEVLCAENLKQANELLCVNEPDMIVLDILLPDGNGIEWCKRIKSRRSIPVLFLSALKESEDIVDGLRAGGDDYLTKPYDLNELIARIEVRLKAAEYSERFISFGELKLDTFSQTASYADCRLFLTQKEYAVLLLVMRYGKSGQGISKSELYETVWGQPLESDSNALWTVISRLKTKLSECKSGITVSFSKHDGYYLERE